MEQKEIAFTWPTFSLTYRADTGEVATFYDQWRVSRTLPDETDDFHGAALGLSAKEHKVVHELAHHLLALHHGLDSSPIIWCAAHCYDMPDGADDEERGVRALVYAAFGTPREEDEPCYASFKSAGVSLDSMVAELRLLHAAACITGTTRPRLQLK